MWPSCQKNSSVRRKSLRAQFPAHHAVPLIDQHRQVAVRLNPLRIGIADDRFRGRADHQRLFEFFAAAVGHDRQFRGKSRDVGFLLFDEAARDQQRKRGVQVTGGLEPPVKRLCDVFPQRPAVGTHDHAAAHRRVIGQLRAQHQLVVPLGKVFGT